MTDAPICRCDVFVHPRRLSNPPGLGEIDYRIGDFAAFRHALLTSLPGETQLLGWRPSASTDLAVQMVEWWAYLADILALYTERAANESYLRTADLPESIDRLIRTLGYRPRPGIGAHGLVGAIAAGKRGLTLPAGFQVQSKPGPGKPPQIFEVDQQTTITVPSVVDVDLPGDGSLVPANGEPGALLDGSVTKVKPGDRLLVLHRSWPGSGSYALTTAKAVRHVKDPRGKPQTLIVFADSLPGLNNPQVADYRLLANPATAHIWPYPADVVFQTTQVELDSIVRGIAVGDPVLFERADGALAPALEKVTVTSEPIWYANGSTSNPAQPPSPVPKDVPLIPIPHTRVEFEPALVLQWLTYGYKGKYGSKGKYAVYGTTGRWDNADERKFAQVRYGWQELGPMLARPWTQVSGQTELTLSPAAGEALPTGVDGRPVLLEDGTGMGAAGQAEQGGTATQLAVDGLADGNGLPPTLDAPLRALFDAVPVSRGQTVSGELLGTGDARLPGQEFVLKNSPVTYLQSGSSYRSTVRVWVDGVEWAEVPTLYAQPPDAPVFATREDEKGMTHVKFGDGEEGARLPSGAQVVANYRYGSGKDAPTAGSLTVIVKPVPGLKSFRNPVPVGGGADPDPPGQIRQYAPRSVLTFGRAISADDYETIAAQAPGVDRARAYWSWDPKEQRSLVTVYVGDTGAAVTAARTALAGADDPNRPLVVLPAVAVPLSVWMQVEVDPRYVQETVAAAVKAALADPATGLFGMARVRIGARLYRSQIYEACLAVPGVVAIHALHVRRRLWWWWFFELGPSFSPGEGRYFELAGDGPTLNTEVALGAA